MSDAIAAVDAGADAIGFLVGMRHLAEDEISQSDAEHVISGIKSTGSDVECVMTTHMMIPDDILKAASAIRADAIQIHDDMDPVDVRKIRETFGGRIVKTVHVTGRDETLSKVLSYIGSCNAILLDSKTSERIGGTGIPCNWDVASDIVKAMRKYGIPVYLAGGLNPENTRAAIEAVHPDGIDMNSGVEYDNGRKSFDKIYAVIQNVNKIENR